MTQQLPNSIYDLIEHVALNKSGWWDAALNNVILAAIWMHGQPVRHVEVRNLLFSAFGLKIPTDRIAERIDGLVSQEDLDVCDDDHVVPSSNVANQMEVRLRAAQQNEDEVRDAFLKKVGNCCAPHSAEDTWDLFHRKFLLPLIDVVGARTIQLMGGDQAGDADVAALTDTFVGHFEDAHRAVLRRAIGSFLDPEDAHVRRYVTEHLDASFLVKASGLTNDAIAGISKFGEKPPTFRLFLDTNFLFSLLNLHENPSNEASQILGKTILKVSTHLTIRMYVIAPTTDEIKRTLRAAQVDLQGIRMSQPLADAVLEVGASGITMRFARANSEAVQPISPQEYFEPYLNDLTPLLKNKGVEVYNERTDGYKHRQDVIDDLDEMTILEGRYEAERQRRYNAALHDSILWHFVHDKRPVVFESPLEAVFWVVTNDYRLINFDRRRRRATKSAAGVCIHPAELVQVLRLWEPRSTDMEQALMSVLRLPFMFYEFDPSREAASMRILKALSRFDHIDELNPETIRDIVLSDAVRSKVNEATSEGEEIELIRDALLAEREEIAEQRDAAINRANQIEEILTEERKAALDRAAADRKGGEQVDARIPELQAELQEAREDQRAIAERAKALEITLNERNAQDRMMSNRNSFAWARGLGVVVTAVVAVGLGYGWIMIGETSPLIVSLSMFVVWVLCGVFVVTTRVQDPNVKEWAPIRTLLNLRRLATWVIATLLLAIVANAIWQELIQPRWFN